MPSSNGGRHSTMSRRELLRAVCVAGRAAAFASLVARAQAVLDELTPAQRGVDASAEFLVPDWKPIFFSAQQNEFLVALSDVMIPAAETPAARQALVNRYLDLLFAAETPSLQQKFLASLRFVDDESRRVYGKPFIGLTSDEQVEVLIPMAYPSQGDEWMSSSTNPAQEHFSRLKSSIADAYYTSEIGMQALGWDGAFAHGEYEGCQTEEPR
jgi:glucoside 3-dehydrogenase (cytochrome c) hitch-hiker subunit